MTRPFRFDRRFRFDVPADRLWAAIADTGRYPRWFPWLARFDATSLATGEVVTFQVRPPLPYRLDLTVEIDDVVDGSLVSGLVGGDLRGPARCEIAGADGGSEARLTWDLELVRPSLRRVERVARPAMVWGHDAVVAVGVRRFRHRAL